MPRKLIFRGQPYFDPTRRTVKKKVGVTRMVEFNCHSPIQLQLNLQPNTSCDLSDKVFVGTYLPKLPANSTSQPIKLNSPNQPLLAVT